ncbi:hypothetical protein BN2476_350101 [Paraburkholderia piptadeniae]|uniref:Uncharacterized protein n=1 Tax=Paraburkholderia piptadeniae TaxID=1701573 RepID=A0A1N7S7N3_9BURK|nr:hypothetical protein BN2476_350101 [Paraburkholderia piptadeniae]
MKAWACNPGAKPRQTWVHRAAAKSTTAERLRAAANWGHVDRICSAMRGRRLIGMAPRKQPHIIPWAWDGGPGGSAYRRPFVKTPASLHRAPVNKMHPSVIDHGKLTNDYTALIHLRTRIHYFLICILSGTGFRHDRLNRGISADKDKNERTAYPQSQANQTFKAILARKVDECRTALRSVGAQNGD